MTPSAEVIYLRSFADRDRDDHAVVGAVLDATAELLVDVAYDDLSTRHIAEKAGVSHSDLCVFFRSKDAIVAEVYLGLLRDAPLSVDPEQAAPARVGALFHQLLMLMADRPGLAAACASALISQQPSVAPIRSRIHSELHRRVRVVLRSRAWPEVAETLGFALVGAMVSASSGSASFADAADDLGAMVAALLPD